MRGSTRSPQDLGRHRTVSVSMVDQYIYQNWANKVTKKLYKKLS